MSHITFARELTTKKFLISRISKIYSTYAIALILSILLFSNKYNAISLLMHSDLSISAKFMLIVSNLIIIPSDAVNFFVSSENFPGLTYSGQALFDQNALWHYLVLPPSWSLAIELYFYLLTPWLLRNRILLIGCTLLSVISRVLTYLIFSEQEPWAGRFFLSALTFYLIGIWIFKFSKTSIFQLATKAFIFLPSKLGVPLEIYGLILLIISFNLIHAHQFATFIPGNLPLLKSNDILTYSLLLVLLPFLFTIFQDSRIDMYLGEITFFVYLIHIPLAREFETVAQNFWLCAGISILIAVLCKPIINKLNIFISKRLKTFF